VASTCSCITLSRFPPRRKTNRHSEQRPRPILVVASMACRTNVVTFLRSRKEPLLRRTVMTLFHANFAYIACVDRLSVRQF